MNTITKFNAPKYRFVVRISNKNVLCQVITARLDHDEVVCAAASSELPRYGIPVGLTNYAACYCTGLLLARRLLMKLGLDSVFTGVSEVTGAFEEVEEEGERRPFTCFLDIGLARSTTGARVFACMKGAVDGGLHIPHSPRRFVGYDEEEKEFYPEELRDRIFGQNVSEYMQTLQGEDPEKYQRLFSRYIKHGIAPEDLEEMYTKAHAAIRANPNLPRPEGPHNPGKTSFGQPRTKKLTLAERKARLLQKKQAYLARQLAAPESDASEEAESSSYE
eukprot:gnl/Chilomastix_cuspidata/97.p2 GENE.gnl/Chilomastix_cuspidata/97~~gnl/Chilomastix_cuspidata/97.p2  ORF type:complete len:276 (+),score=161.32 gnl/Chilomastix_cuspidata/97:136-963(+)